MRVSSPIHFRVLAHSQEETELLMRSQHLPSEHFAVIAMPTQEPHLMTSARARPSTLKSKQEQDEETMAGMPAFHALPAKCADVDQDQIHIRFESDPDKAQIRSRSIHFLPPVRL